MDPEMLSWISRYPLSKAVERSSLRRTVREISGGKEIAALFHGCMALYDWNFVIYSYTEAGLRYVFAWETDGDAQTRPRTAWFDALAPLAPFRVRLSLADRTQHVPLDAPFSEMSPVVWLDPSLISGPSRWMCWLSWIRASE